MPFPVTLNGITFNLSDFAPLGYVAALPASAEAMADTMLKDLTATSATSHSVTAGTITLTVQAGKGFIAGMGAMLSDASNINRFAGGVIVSYNTTTGVLVVTREYGASTGTVTSWNVTGMPYAPNSLPQGILMYGNGAPLTRVRRGITAMAEPETGMEEIQEDFVCQGVILNNYPGIEVAYVDGSLPGWVIDSNTSGYINVQGIPLFPRVAPGGLRMELSEPAGRAAQCSARYGKNAYIPVDETGVLMFHAVIDSVLSSAGTGIQQDSLDFVWRVGMRGENSSTLGDIFSSFGIGFEVVCNASTGWLTSLYAVFSIGGVRQTQFLRYVDNVAWAAIDLAFMVKNGTVEFFAKPQGTAGKFTSPDAIFDVNWKAGIQFVHPALSLTHAHVERTGGAGGGFATGNIDSLYAIRMFDRS